MSDPATPLDALLVPADVDAVTGDAAATSPEQQALATESIASAPPPKEKVVVADMSMKSFAADYFTQVYQVPRQDVRFVQNLQGLAGVLGAYPAISDLYLLFHAGEDHLLFGYPDTTSAVPLGDVATELAKRREQKSITNVYFDSCTLGLEPVALFEFAQTLGASQVVGWSRWHYIGVWAPALTSPDITVLDQPTLDLLARGAPWATVSAGGDTYTADALEDTLLSAKSFRVIVELFNASMLDVDFDALLLFNTFIPDRHAHRVDKSDVSVITLDEAKALGADITPLGPLKRVIARPIE